MWSFARCLTIFDLKFLSLGALKDLGVDPTGGITRLHTICSYFHVN